MTLLEKIKKLKWFDSISKLRDILEELYNSSSGGSGGSQDLQSVLDNGTTATADNGLSECSLLGGGTNKRSFSFISQDGAGFSSQLVLGKQNILLSNGNSAGGFGAISVQQGLTFTHGNLVTNKFTSVAFLEPEVLNITLYFPSKPNVGQYTIATLDDILKIDLDSRVYANNAAAITGGLTAKDLYRTATGELRIVV